MAAKVVGERLTGFAPEPQAKLAELGIEAGAQQEGWGRAGRGLLALPDDVQDDVLERGVAVMAVGLPTAGAQVNLDVAGAGRGIAELDEGVAEVGAAFEVVEAGVKDADGVAIEGEKLVAEHALMLPDRLEEALRR